MDYESLLESNELGEKRDYSSASACSLSPFWSIRPLLLSPKRVLFILCLVSIVLCILAIANGGIPPSYSRIKTYESLLAQHDWNSKSSGVHEQKYLSFPDHIWGHGFNNFLQEMCVPRIINEKHPFIFHSIVFLLHTSLTRQTVHMFSTATFGLTFPFPTRCTILPGVQRAFHSMHSYPARLPEVRCRRELECAQPFQPITLIMFALLAQEWQLHIRPHPQDKNRMDLILWIGGENGSTKTTYAIYLVLKSERRKVAFLTHSQYILLLNTTLFIIFFSF